MQKFNRNMLGNAMSVLVYNAMDGGFTSVEHDLDSVEQIEFAAKIQRALDEGKRRVVIDLVAPPKEPAK